MLAGGGESARQQPETYTCLTDTDSAAIWIGSRRVQIDLLGAVPTTAAHTEACRPATSDFTGSPPPRAGGDRRLHALSVCDYASCSDVPSDPPERALSRGLSLCDVRMPYLLAGVSVSRDTIALAEVVIRCSMASCRSRPEHR